MTTRTASAITIASSQQACGAVIAGVDLSAPLSENVIQQIRAAWLRHHVLVFPDQDMCPADLERFTQAFGALGAEPFIAPLPGHKHIIPVKRYANQTGPVFADTWHTDWSFLEQPPLGTCLYAITVPPIGGDTLFANQHAALEAMPDTLRQKLEGQRAIHSAANAYAPDGTYSQMDPSNRSMIIEPSTDAYASLTHPIIKPHSETGRNALFGTRGHIIGFEDMDEPESTALLGELYRWQTRPEFQYRHKWTPNMLVMWDNRSVLHMATGGYQGHDRLLHRTMIWPAAPNSVP